MFAVIKTGGKQYLVRKGQKLTIEKLPEKEGSKVVFSDVLLIADDKKAEVGRPLVSGASVEGKIVKQTKGPKLVVFKFKPKKRYKVKRGHRQHYTEVEITKIGTSKQ